MDNKRAAMLLDEPGGGMVVDGFQLRNRPRIAPS
jgi:hypothetical protein